MTTLAISATLAAALCMAGLALAVTFFGATGQPDIPALPLLALAGLFTFILADLSSDQNEHALAFRLLIVSIAILLAVVVGIVT